MNRPPDTLQDDVFLSEEEREGQGSPSAGWRHLLTFSTRRHACLLTAAVVLSTITGLTFPATAYLLGKIFDSFSAYGSGEGSQEALISSVNHYAIYLSVLGGASWVLNSAFFATWVSFGEAQAKQARTVLFATMMAKDMSWYETQTAGPGAVVARVQTRIRELQTATSQPFGLVVQHTATVLGSIGLAFYSSWDLTLITLASVPVGVLVLAFISARMQPAIERQAEALTAATNAFKSAIDAIEIVKCFNAQNSECAKYVEIIKQSGIHYLTLARANSMQLGFVRLMTRTLFVQGFWYGSYIVMKGRKSSGDVLTAFWSCLMATQVFEQILPQLVVMERGRAAGWVLTNFRGHSDQEGPKATPIGLIPTKCVGDINLRNVSFAYSSQPDRQALANVSMFVPAGETTYIVGRSGAGKSVLAALLIRLYDDWKGDITIDRREIEKLNLQWLRRNVTIVQQDSVLFNDTVLRNIAFGRGVESNIKQSSLDAAIEMASLRGTLEDLPNGFDTVIGPGGTLLSGGQTQRVAIARARLRDAPILVLDEITSALDQATAENVMAAILRWRVDKTTVIITHDLEQIGPDDYVFVLDEGHVVQEGYRKMLEAVPNSTFFKLLLSNRPDSALPSRTNNQRSRPASRGATLIDPRRSIDMGPDLSKKLPVSPLKAYSRRLLRDPDSAMSMLSNVLENSKSPKAGSILTSPAPVHWSSKPDLSIVEVNESSAFAEDLTRNGRHWVATNRDQDEDMHEIDRDARLDRMLLTPSSRREQRGNEATISLTMSKILATVWPRLETRRRLLLIVGFFCGTAHAACTPMFSYAFAQLLATFYLPEDKPTKALKWSLTLMGLTIIDTTATFLFHYLLENCAEAWVLSIRTEAMARVLDQPKSWFESAEADITHLVEHLDRGAEDMKHLLSQFAGLIYVAFVMMGIGLIWCLLESWQLTLVGISTTPLVYTLTVSFDRISAKWEGKSHRASEAASSIFNETFEKIKVVRSLALEGHFRGKFGRAISTAQKTGRKRAFVAGVCFGIADASIVFITGLIFWHGATLVAKGRYQVTPVTTVFSMLLFVISNVNSIVSIMPQLSSSRETATNLLRLTRLSSFGNHEYLGNIMLKSLPGPIRFRNVRFSYPSRPGVLTLNRLNMEIPLGFSTALVGMSGSGKSTIIALLLQMRSLHGNGPGKPTFQGSLSVGDIPLAQLDVKSWRSMIAYVPQESKIFPGTIYSNIAYGLSAEEVFEGTMRSRRAATAAGIDTFIQSLPFGYRTLIGEGGVGLSGGQKQKLGVARALFRQPKLLIMDEPTSAMDATSAAEIRDLICELVAGRCREVGYEKVTVLVVTHSLEMMRVCNRICVLEDGQLAQEGTFDELRGRLVH